MYGRTRYDNRRQRQQKTKVNIHSFRSFIFFLPTQQDCVLPVVSCSLYCLVCFIASRGLQVYTSTVLKRYSPTRFTQAIAGSMQRLDELNSAKDYVNRTRSKCKRLSLWIYVYVILLESEFWRQLK